MKNFPGPLIRPGVESSDPTYMSLRDRAELERDRVLVEHFWSAYWPYADETFYSDLPRDFFARFWEMDLSCTLLELGCTLRERSDSGPDVCVEGKDGPVWLEAVAPRAGLGRNTAPELAPDVKGHEFTDDDRGGVPGFGAVILRYRNAIEEKRSKYEHYLDRGIVRERESFVIALNGLRVPGSIVDDDDVPTILKAVYPLGAPRWHFNFTKGEVTDIGPNYRGGIKTAAGSEVATDVFLQEMYAGISGVLFARQDVYNRPAREGAGLVLVHNREASSPLERGWIKAGREFWPEEGSIRSHNWESSG